MKLGVNVDHVATLRQARGGREPDPVWAAAVCEKAGAHSIVMHLREDRRHIQDHDVFRTGKSVSVKFNLEMSIAPSIVKIALKRRPDQVTLVPEKRQERTTEGGLDLLNDPVKLARALRLFRKEKIRVSLFIDPDAKQVREARRLGVEAVEFHTGDYANQTSRPGARRELKRLENAVRLARAEGLAAHAGHGLDYRNVSGLREIEGIEELNIGYSIICRALWVGLDRAVRDMRRLVA